MPMMHRLSCFRDDVIFVIYLYQRWTYPVDKTRPVEGFDVEESTAEQAAAASGTAKPAPVSADVPEPSTAPASSSSSEGSDHSDSE